MCLAICKMKTAHSRFWTRDTISISRDGYYYTTNASFNQFIYPCLLLGSILHKVSLKVKVIKERVTPLWTTLVIRSVGVIWTKYPNTDLDSLRVMWMGHICLLIAWTRLEGLVLCFSINDSSPTRRWPGWSLGPFCLNSIIELDTQFGTNARWPCY